MLINRILIIFIINPVFSISFNSIFPLENAMAFGGVPIGNIPAQLAPKVIGMPNNNG